MTVSLTPEAKKELDAYFEGKEKGDIRIFMAPGGCSGPRLVLALDEPKDEDEVLDVDGYKFCIDKNLANDTGDIRIELNDMGFMVIPEKPLPQPAGGGCGGCCGGCGGN